MKKTVAVTANVSLALKRRLAKEAARQGKTMSAFLEDQLSFYYYGRGRTLETVKEASIFDKPMPAHIKDFQNNHKGNIH